MPATPEGVYADKGGQWYFKVTLGRDPLTGRREQITRRGFRTASDAARARKELLERKGRGQVKVASGGTLTVNDLLDLYLDGLDADERLSPKTRHDYRIFADTYLRGHIGKKKVRDVTPEVVLTWQRRLLKEGSPTGGRPLSPNTIRLARSPLAGAFKLALQAGIVAVNPVAQTPQPKARRSVPKHWSPEEARRFLALMEGDRTWTVWAFLMGSGLRIGELVALRWPNVHLEAKVVRVVEFSTYVGHDVVPSTGKSRDAIHSIDLDDGLVKVLRDQRRQQAAEQVAATSCEASDHVFTRPAGGPYHPQQLSRRLGELTAELDLPRLTAHGLRHTGATLMLANGVAPKVAAERLGHSDPSLFMNLYRHVTPTMQREAAEKIGAALFGER
ncbi:MAG: site-specific integrase [Actinomycetota bacterium]|nr:site-specific integrase [Actinomycetota bacterium]